MIPRAIREEQGVRPGDVLDVEVAEDGAIILRRRATRRRTTLAEVRGMSKWGGPPVSVEEMDEGIERYFREEREDL